MHWGSYSRLAWPKAVTLLAASHPSENRRSQAQAQAQEMVRETIQSDREKDQALWTLVFYSNQRYKQEREEKKARWVKSTVEV